MTAIKWNERAWSGQIIGWIKLAIENKTTIFQEATNDSSLKVESGRTKFPDILLFSDKTSGIIFNGWELKFPDTAVDDLVMLDNALEKAKKINSDSFVTWNGTEAVIWGIDTDNYSIETLIRLKEYPKVPTITTREDLADYGKYATHERELKNRLGEILHDLEQLYIHNNLRPALNISGSIIESIRKTATIVIPQFQKAIIKEHAENPLFRKEYKKWKIYESATIKILESSSRRVEKVEPEEVLAKFTFYNLVGKILFYLTLCENLSGELQHIEINKEDVKELLTGYFNKAKEIDYQAIFQPYFTDDIVFSLIANKAILALLKNLTAFDFRILPSNMIGYVLENLVPKDEKQKFGQYFTPETLANLVAFPAVQTRNSVIIDPTSGTGTFLNAFYKILNYYGNRRHSDLLNQIWGNDISHFPAILSVINLYKQEVKEVDNFPRVMRDDFFNLEVGKPILFPDSQDYTKHETILIPQFDGIASNFPFVRQEDIPNNVLTEFFREKFETTQKTFLKGTEFEINERADYFTYCTYQSYRLLKDNGLLACITSNAWLGKEYGIQFKRFLLDNFHIKYIVKSNAEHWFKDSQVSTIFFVLEKAQNDFPTRFVTINRKLSETFNQDNINVQLSQIEDFYGEIEFCDDPKNNNWEQNTTFKDLYKRNDGSVTCCVVSKNDLRESLQRGNNWATFFISAHIFEDFDSCLTQYHPNIAQVIRGERTGWNPMFVIPNENIAQTRISPEYLVPYLKSSSDLEEIEFKNIYNHKAFVCDKETGQLDNGTKSWIMNFVNIYNKNGSQTIPEACAGHSPYWYSINPKKVNIITTINPYKRFFFTYSIEPFVVDQRLIGLQVQPNYNIQLIAALLNSAITFLILEMRGTSRNLGALDLNANYLKQLRILNPDLLSAEAKKNILKAFSPLKNRKVEDISVEVTRADRIAFDTIILSSFGLDTSLLSSIYEILVTSVENRVAMSGR